MNASCYSCSVQQVSEFNNEFNKLNLDYNPLIYAAYNQSEWNLTQNLFYMNISLSQIARREGVDSTFKAFLI